MGSRALTNSSSVVHLIRVELSLLPVLASEGLVGVSDEALVVGSLLMLEHLSEDVHLGVVLLFHFILTSKLLATQKYPSQFLENALPAKTHSYRTCNPGGH